MLVLVSLLQFAKGNVSQDSTYLMFYVSMFHPHKEVKIKVNYLLDRDSKKDRKMKQELLKQIDYKPVWLVLDRHIH